MSVIFFIYMVDHLDFIEKSVNWVHLDLNWESTEETVIFSENWFVFELKSSE